MKQREVAAQLVEAFETCTNDREMAKDCAIQHVFHMTEELEELKGSLDDSEVYMINNRIGFYIGVRAEIKKL